MSLGCCVKLSESTPIFTSRCELFVESRNSLLMLQELPLCNASPILMLQEFPVINAIPILMLQSIPLISAIPILM